METGTTFHSIERVCERRHYKNRKAAEHNIRRALLKGKGAEEFSSMEKYYLKSIGRNGAKALAYDYFCYIVASNGDCITSYELPEWFGRKSSPVGKQSIGQYRRSCRFNDYYEEARSYIDELRN